MNRRTQESKADRNVIFEPAHDDIVLIENAHNFSKTELERSWYSKAEMQSMLQRCARDADRLESGGKKRKQSSSRGLESLTTEGRESLEASIYACIDAVIDEQDIQWEDDFDDQERLAVASQEISRHSLNEAIERAIKDERAARRIYMLDDQQQLGPPTMPIRRVSEELSLYFEQSFDDKEPQDEIPPTVLEEPKLISLAVSSNKDTSKHVGLGTCYTTQRKDGCGPEHIVPKANPMRAKAA